MLPNEIAQWLLVGAALKVQAQFYAISLERKIKHPAVLAICERASEIFSDLITWTDWPCRCAPSRPFYRPRPA